MISREQTSGVGRDPQRPGNFLFQVYGDITQEESIVLSDKRNIFERDVRVPDFDDEEDSVTIAANIASINSNRIIDDLDQDFET